MLRLRCNAGVRPSSLVHRPGFPHIRTLPPCHLHPLHTHSHPPPTTKSLKILASVPIYRAPNALHRPRQRSSLALTYRGPPNNDWSHRRAYVRRTWGWHQMALDEDKLAWLLIIINVAVFVLWWFMGQTQRGRKWMIDHFTVSLRNVRQGRVWTILTSNYSQVQPMHLLANCLGIYFFCPPIIAALGARRFMGLYTAGGVCSSFAHLFMHRNDPASPALGASGALNAVSVLFGCLNPTATLLLWGIIPMPAGVATAAFVGKDLLGLVGGSRDHVSHEGHLAGAAVGGLYFLALRR